MPQVVRLLEMVFGETLDAEGQRMFAQMGNAQAPFLWRWSQGLAQLSPGFVWEENGRIIGNVTLLPAQTPRRFLIANVAVHPDFRRRGMARGLMQAVLEAVDQRRGQTVLLQVVKDNYQAVNLYRSLGFVSVGSMIEWQAMASRLRELPLVDNRVETRPLRRPEWQEAYQLDLSCLHPDLNWPDPVRMDAYKTGWWRQLGNFLNGRQQETWTTSSSSGQLIGMATIASEWGRVHRLSVRVRPAWRGQLERPLIAKLIRRLRYLPRRNLRIDHPDQDENVNQLLEEANFTARRTLTHMRLDL
ncbi:MAG: GNAT family N-acetyltransferase [Chloroflexota bacterium]